MRKQSLKSLALNKKSISNLETSTVKGKGTLHPISILLGGGSWCICK